MGVKPRNLGFVQPLLTAVLLLMLLQMYRYVFDTTLTDKRQRVVADFIVHCGLANASLRDEIYIQLCNLSFPRSSSPGDISTTQRTWQLMAHCLSCFKPSNALYSYLLKSVDIRSYFQLKHKPQLQRNRATFCVICTCFYA